jgi:hypothetical protein
MPFFSLHKHFISSSGVDLQGMTGKTIAGDAHFFEDATTPAKVRAYLDSPKVGRIEDNDMNYFNSQIIALSY